MRLRKILRRTFLGAAGVSTVLLLATLVLWPVSYSYSLAIRYRVPGESASMLGASLGRWGLMHAKGPVHEPRGFELEADRISAIMRIHDGWTYRSWCWGLSSALDPTRLEYDVKIIGFESYHSDDLWGLFTFVQIPCSHLSLLFSILPVLAFRSIRRQRKLARVGMCQKCGYDLRAIILRCPECGTPITTSSAPAVSPTSPAPPKP